MSYCSWALGRSLDKKYHDEEWGLPVFDDQKHFEVLSLEIMQAGLSWSTILKKRDNLRRAFDGFDYNKVAAYDSRDLDRIMGMDGVIRYDKKIKAIIQNARAFLEVRSAFGSFTSYIWSFTEGKSILYDKHKDGYIPSSNGLSARIAKDLKKRNFTFVGPVVMYSHLQATGVINDHDRRCPRYDVINNLNETIHLPRDAEKKVDYYG